MATAGKLSTEGALFCTNLLFYTLMRRQVGAAIEGVVRERVTPINSLAVDTPGHTHFGSDLVKLLVFDLYTRRHDMRDQWLHGPNVWPQVLGLEAGLQRHIDVDSLTPRSLTTAGNCMRSMSATNWDPRNVEN